MHFLGKSIEKNDTSAHLMQIPVCANNLDLIIAEIYTRQSFCWETLIKLNGKEGGGVKSTKKCLSQLSMPSCIYLLTWPEK